LSSKRYGWPFIIARHKSLWDTTFPWPREIVLDSWAEAPKARSTDVIRCKEPLVSAQQVAVYLPIIEAALLTYRAVVAHCLLPGVLSFLPPACIIQYSPSIWAHNLPLDSLRGRLAWIISGHPRDQWRTFLELTTRGVWVAGLTVHATKVTWSADFVPTGRAADVHRGTASLVRVWRYRVAQLCTLSPGVPPPGPVEEAVPCKARVAGTDGAATKRGSCRPTDPTDQSICNHTGA